MVNVTDALRAQGLDIQQPPGLFIPRGALDAPGQGIEIDGDPGFIFLYPDVETARLDAEDADADADAALSSSHRHFRDRVILAMTTLVRLLRARPQTRVKLEYQSGCVLKNAMFRKDCRSSLM